MAFKLKRVLKGINQNALKAGKGALSGFAKGGFSGAITGAFKAGGKDIREQLFKPKSGKLINQNLLAKVNATATDIKNISAAAQQGKIVNSNLLVKMATAKTTTPPPKAPAGKVVNMNVKNIAAQSATTAKAKPTNNASKTKQPDKPDLGGWKWPWQIKSETQTYKAEYWAANWWKVALLALIPLALIIGIIYIILVSSKRAKAEVIQASNPGSNSRITRKPKRGSSKGMNKQAQKQAMMTDAQKQAWAAKMQAARRAKAKRK